MSQPSPIIVAILTRRLGHNHKFAPSADTVRYRVRDAEKAIEDMEIEQVFDLMCQVVRVLSDDRMEIRSFDYSPADFDACVAQAKALVAEKFEADRLEMQDEYDHDSDEFRADTNGYYRNVTVVDGQVVDPWGYTSKAQTDWWLDNVTPLIMAVLYTYLLDTATEAAREHFHNWAAGGTDDDPRDLVEKAFEDAAHFLYKLSEETVKGEG